jgi:hypothetical protein
MRLSNDQMLCPATRHRINTINDLAEKWVFYRGNDHAHGSAFPVFQALCQGIRLISKIAGSFQHPNFGTLPYFKTIVKRPGHRRHRNSEVLCYIFYRCRPFVELPGLFFRNTHLSFLIGLTIICARHYSIPNGLNFTALPNP